MNSDISRDATHMQGSPDLTGLATCPSCHTAELSVTNLALDSGADWQCARCGQRWDARRLATVSAYAVWLAEAQGRARNPLRHLGR